jgi:signal transduction histidine kinase
MMTATEARRPIRWFRDLPIRRKLTLVTVATSAAVLALATGAFLTYELITFRQTLAENLATQAQIIASNSAAAVVFKDANAAAKTLSALSAEGHIQGARTLLPDGTELARFIRRGLDRLPPFPEARPGHVFEPDHLTTTSAIVVDGETVGLVQIQSDLNEVRDRLNRYLGIAVLVFIAALLAALPLSTRLQAVISDPIQRLAATAQLVSDSRDYGVRATPAGNDEIGVMIATFNTMLAQIQRHDQELNEARSQLEVRVLERTAELRQEITERTRAETEVRRLNDELEQRVEARTAELAAANKELEAFSYSVSHDLRAPLRSIDGFSRILQEDCAAQLDDNGRGYLERMRAAANRMGRLIDDLLSLSRLSRSEMHRQRIDLSAEARAIAADLREQDPGRNVTFTIRDGLEAHGDVALLRAVLSNLIGNAWKYTSKRDAAAIEFGSFEAEGERVFFVRDDGAGFDMSHVGKLFGAFQRLHSVKEFDGTGIGLATVQRIVHRHGGRVWAEAAVDQGATFFFTLG